MSISNLKNIPPWEWPINADKLILDTLRDENTPEADRLVAVGMSGDATVVNDELADHLLAVIGNEDESDDIRGRAAISLGPALEYAYIEEFEDPDEVPISETIFHKIQQTLYALFLDEKLPKIVRRRILEASVRAPQDWHPNAVRDAYRRSDEDWNLTAVFCMQYIRGFDAQILESLTSENINIVYEAVCGAGNWEIKAAWAQIAGFITSEETDKDVRLAAIEAAPLIRPLEAAEILGPLLASDDEDIVDVAYEALGMTEAFWDDDDELPTIH